MIIPDVLEQHLAGDRLPGIAHEIFEQGEFHGLQVDLFTVADHFAGQKIERKIADRQLRWVGDAAGPADQRLDKQRIVPDAVPFTQQNQFAVLELREHVIREILAYEPRGRRTALGPSLERLARMLKRRSVLVLVSDFRDEGYERALKLCALKHDLVPVVVEDPVNQPFGLHKNRS